jgi:hypothetical protein
MEAMCWGVSCSVRAWWITLCAVSLVNVVVWWWSSRLLVARERSAPGILEARRPHLLLSAGYVLGCGFRSLLPRADVQRIVLVDSFLSSIVVGRSVATVAELCFAAQWALLLRELSEAEGQRFGVAVSKVIVPLIAVAELCSWYAVLSTSYVGNALEQSLWTFTVALLGAALIVLWRSTREVSVRVFTRRAILACAAFVVFMCTVDVPMYLTRYVADLRAGRPTLSLVAGLADVSSRWHVTESLADWREEIPWMTLYFSFAVWISIGLAHAPRIAARRAHAPRL